MDRMAGQLGETCIIGAGDPRGRKETVADGRGGGNYQGRRRIVGDSKGRPGTTWDGHELPE